MDATLTTTEATAKARELIMALTAHHVGWSAAMIDDEVCAMLRRDHRFTPSAARATVQRGRAAYAARQAATSGIQADIVRALLQENNAGAGEPMPVRAQVGPVRVWIFESHDGTLYLPSATWYSLSGSSVHEQYGQGMSIEAAVAWCEDYAGTNELSWQ